MHNKERVLRFWCPALGLLARIILDIVVVVSLIMWFSFVCNSCFGMLFCSHRNNITSVIVGFIDMEDPIQVKHKDTNMIIVPGEDDSHSSDSDGDRDMDEGKLVTRRVLQCPICLIYCSILYC